MGCRDARTPLTWMGTTCFAPKGSSDVLAGNREEEELSKELSKELLHSLTW